MREQPGQVHSTEPSRTRAFQAADRRVSLPSQPADGHLQVGRAGLDRQLAVGEGGRRDPPVGGGGPFRPALARQRRAVVGELEVVGVGRLEQPARPQLAGQRLERRVVEPADRLDRRAVSPAAGAALGVEQVDQRVGLGHGIGCRGLSPPAGREPDPAVALGALEQAFLDHPVEQRAHARSAGAERGDQLHLGERPATLRLRLGERGQHRLLGILGHPLGHAAVELLEHAARRGGLVGADRLARQQVGQRRVQRAGARLVQLDADALGRHVRATAGGRARARCHGQAVGTQTLLEVLAQDGQPLGAEVVPGAPAGVVGCAAAELAATGLADLALHGGNHHNR